DPSGTEGAEVGPVPAEERRPTETGAVRLPAVAVTGQIEPAAVEAEVGEAVSVGSVEIAGGIRARLLDGVVAVGDPVVPGVSVRVGFERAVGDLFVAKSQGAPAVYVESGVARVDFHGTAKDADGGAVVEYIDAEASLAWRVDLELAGLHGE